MDFTADTLAEVNKLDPCLQYYFVLAGPMKWVLVQEVVEGNRRHQTVAMDDVSEDSIKAFLKGKLGDKPPVKPEKGIFKNLLEN